MVPASPPPIAPGSVRLPLRWWARATALVLARPRLWSTAGAQMGRLAPAGWWHRPPFLPRPPAEYLRFRLATQYGRSDALAPGQADADDLVEYLEWCRTVCRPPRGVRRAPR